MLKKIILLTLIVICLFCIIAKTYWFILFSICIISISLVPYTLKKKRIVNKNDLLDSFTSIATVLIIGFSIRFFVIDIYRIPGSSMECSILPGDRVVVNKLLIGPVLPTSLSEIPLINLFCYQKPYNENKKDSLKWNYIHLAGFTKIKHQDILVFGLGPQDKNRYIKRCVALPGDTLYIKNSHIYINGINQLYPNTIKHRYRLHSKKINKTLPYLDSIGVPYFQVKGQHNKNEVIVILTKKYHQIINNQFFIDSLNRYIEKKVLDAEFHSVFEGLNWSRDCFGPIIIPFEGFKLKLNHINYLKYNKIIQQEQISKPSFKNDLLKIIETDQPEYTFQNDYYFMLGDNRYESIDSRHFGLVPETFIFGKTNRILISYSNKKVHFQRILKRLK